MSVTKLNKISGLAPENETPEEHQGPPKNLNEIIKVTKNIKIELWEVEHYIDKSKGSEAGIKNQLEEQLMKTKQEMVKLERMLSEELEAEQEYDNLFEK